MTSHTCHRLPIHWLRSPSKRCSSRDRFGISRFPFLLTVLAPQQSPSVVLDSLANLTAAILVATFTGVVVPKGLAWSQLADRDQLNICAPLVKGEGGVC